jgi:cell division septation protein DedD
VGLVFLCGFCFFIGYSMGHCSSQFAQAIGMPPVAGVEASSHFSSNQPKPPATPQMVSTPADQASLKPDGVNPSAGQEADRTIDPGTQSGATLAPDDDAFHPQPALSPEPAAKQEPAINPTSAPMVEVAAVSDPEDADLLVSALGKRGYTVTVRYDPVDSLLHVRLGPFSDREEAEKWRLKLLDDGYNAILQP